MIPSIDLIEPRRRRLARWIGAATLIGAIHVAGGSLAMLYWQEAMMEESSGAIVVEIAPTATSLAMDTLDLPPGPLVEQGAVQAASDTKIDKPEQDAPTEDLPSPTESEVAVQKPTQVEEKPKEDPSPQVKAQQQVGANKTSAPTRIVAETAAKSVAPDAGISKVNSRSIASWQNSVVAHLNRHKRLFLTKTPVEGIALVRFTMDRSGRLSASQVVRSSGFALLDEEALALLKRASPLPRPPLAMPGESFDLDIPVTFNK